MIDVRVNQLRRPHGAALAVAAFLAGLGTVLIWNAGLIPVKEGYAGVGSGDVPRFVGYGLWLLALGHLVTAFRGGDEEKEELHIGPVLWVVGGLALQIAFLHPLGFSIASGTLFAMTAAGFGKRNLALTLPVGFGIALLVYGVFDQLLRLKLPTGFVETLIFGG